MANVSCDLTSQHPRIEDFMTLEVVQSTMFYTRLCKKLTSLTTKKLTQTKSCVNIRHLSLLEIAPAE